MRQALHVLDVAIREGERYDPAASERTFRLHMSDIGETIFLPRLMQVLARRGAARAPRDVPARRQGHPPALESGRIDLALGYIPALADVERALLLSRALRRA